MKNNPHYTESYISRIKRQHEERRQQRLNAPKPPTLEEQITAWWDTLSDEERQQEYTMEFFKDRFNATANKLGPVLFALGWERRRRWKVNGPHVRYWVKLDG